MQVCAKGFQGSRVIVQGSEVYKGLRVCSGFSQGSYWLGRSRKFSAVNAVRDQVSSWKQESRIAGR